MNNLYNTDLPLSMRLSGVTVNTPDEYQNLLNALYKNTFADPAYVQEQRAKVSGGSSKPFAAGGIGDPVYEQAQAQEWKDYVQKKLGEFGIQAPQTPQVAEQQETPKLPVYAYGADPLTNNTLGPDSRNPLPQVAEQQETPITNNSLGPNRWNPFTVYSSSYPQVSKENLDTETVQNVDKDQEKEQASQSFLDDYIEIKDQEKEQTSQNFLDDYIASADWPSGPAESPQPPVIPATDPKLWPMIPGGPTPSGPAGTGTSYPLAETQNDTLVAATYPSDPKWMREIDRSYQETKNKPYSPGESKPRRGMGDTWRRNKAEVRQDKRFDTAKAKAVAQARNKYRNRNKAFA